MADQESAIWHGGDLAAAAALFPNAPQPWIDLSTGINPVPYPVGELSLSLFHRLPSPQEHRALEEIAGSAYGVLEGAACVAAPGTQCLIEILPPSRPPSRVAVVGPTYAEHAITWRKSGHEVREVDAFDEAVGADVVVTVNPNNPDGRQLRRDDLVQASRNLPQGGLLVVDEAFADLENDESLAPALPENALVLRSFGKTYGLAGVRLGFALAHPRLAAELRARLGPWSVSGPAIALGRIALADEGWLAAAGAARAEDAARLDDLLAPRLGSSIGGTVLFRSFRSDAAPGVFEALGRAGIWVRRFSWDHRLLRFGLPGAEEAWSRLEAVVG